MRRAKRIRKLARAAAARANEGRRRIAIPEPVTAVHLPTGQPFRVVDEDADDEEKVYDDKGRQTAPLKPDRPWDMQRFLVTFVFGDPAFGKEKLQAWRMQHAILDALEAAEEAGEDAFEVSRVGWERMRRVIDSWEEEEESADDGSTKRKRRARREWNDALMLQLLPFMEAIQSAEEVRDEPEEEADADDEPPPEAA